MFKNVARAVTPELLTSKSIPRSTSLDLRSTKIKLASIEKRTYPLNIIPSYKPPGHSSRKAPKMEGVPSFINEYMQDQNPSKIRVKSSFGISKQISSHRKATPCVASRPAYPQPPAVLC